MSTAPIQGLEPLWSVFPGEAGKAEEPSAGSGMFADIYQSAIDSVETTDAEKNQALYLLATGQMDNPAEYSLAATKAQAAAEMLIQLRNKALDAYSELMRINL